MPTPEIGECGNDSGRPRVATRDPFSDEEAAPGHAVCYQPPRYVGNWSRWNAPSPSKT